MAFPEAFGFLFGVPAVANPYLLSELLDSIKRRGMIPTAASALASTDFYDIANEELQAYMLDVLSDVNEEHLVSPFATDYAITASQANYRVPSRAIDGKVRDVLMSTDSGATWTSLPRVEPTQVTEYGGTGTPEVYTVEGANIVLLPTPSTTSGTLRVKYPVRPNRLVPWADSSSTEVGEITAVDTATNSLTVAYMPSSFQTTVNYDFVRGTPHFDHLAIDQTATLVGGTSMTFSSLPSGLAVGDFVCLAGESPVPQLPVSLHQLLALRVVAVALRAVGDKAAADAAEQLAEKKKQEAVKRMKPRVAGSSRVIVNPWGPGKRAGGY